MSSTEHPNTYLSRRKLKEILRPMNYEIEEEVALESVKNNMQEDIFPPYQADMIASKVFVIELDPQSNKKGKSKGHGTRRRRIHDEWRDKNIKSQLNLRTVRLDPKDILEQSKEQILAEINNQLKENG